MTCKKCKGSGKRWGLKVGTGSMGLGLPAAVGFALAKKLKGEDGKVYVLMSDGEMQCGTTWESALIAAQHKLDNLVVIVDNNGFQAMGKTSEILNIESLEKIWDSFGWFSTSINGHNYDDIEKAMYLPKNYSKERPVIFFAETIKGKGVSFMENSNLYHYKAPSDKEYLEALKELNV